MNSDAVKKKKNTDTIAWIVKLKDSMISSFSFDFKYAIGLKKAVPDQKRE